MARDAGRAGTRGRGRRARTALRLAAAATLTLLAGAAGPGCRPAETTARPDAVADVAPLPEPDAPARDADAAPATTADAAADMADEAPGDIPETELGTLVVELGPALTERAARDGTEAFAAGDFEEAARLFDDARRGLAETAAGWYEATLMSGLAHLEAGAERRAALRLGELAEREHALRPFVRLQLARAELGRRKPETALALLDDDWQPPYAADATRRRAEALLALGRPAEALEVCGRIPADDRTPYDRLLAARAACEAARAAATPAAAPLDRCRAGLDELRKIRAERPGTVEADEADALLRTHAELLPPAERRRLLDLTLADRLERVRRLTAAYRYDVAQREAQRLIDDTAPQDRLRCTVLRTAADAWYRARDYGRAAELLEQTLAACDGTDDWPEAAWRSGKALLNAGRDADAAQRFAELERTAPHHSLADDARLARAELALAAGDARAFEALAGTLARDFPNADLADEATWQLGRYKLAAGRAGDAEQDFARLVARGWTSPEAPQGGRARYWHAVALAAGERPDEAREELRWVLRRHPLTFYGLLAYGRLRLEDAPAARRLLDEALAGRGAPEPPQVELPDLPVLRTDGFRRALALLRLGLFDAAEAEIDALRAGPGVPAAAGTALSLLAERLGAYRLGRRLGGLGRAPLGHDPLDVEHLRSWRLAYPHGFRATVTRAAEAQTLPEALLLGFIREESGFEPRAFSSAHAVGLMQLLVPTAERFAPAAGVTGAISRRRLNRPSINVPIGAAFLRFLADRYPDRTALLPAAYNAGEGRLDRWLREHGHLPLDQFVEAIPYDQTRTYLMRVVSSWAVYQALYAEDPTAEPVPVLDPTIVADPARATDATRPGP
jgi:soluble lytic murein transglycosylase